jgi:hypothetical protein
VIVYTYFDPQVPGGRSPAHSGVLRLWSESWRRHGWEPRVLGPRDAKKHPRYAEFLARVRTYPTINPRGYEDACYLRWLAFAHVKGGLMVDYDVICNGAMPGGMLRPHNSSLKKANPDITFFDTTYVPCAVLATEKGANMLCAYLYGHLPHGTHCSDMHIFKAEATTGVLGPAGWQCLEYGVPGWDKSPVIHFASGKVQGFPSKAAAIQHALNHVGR